MLLTGFSTLTTTKGFRGDDSKINDCMWALIHYAARVAPQVVMFESVQQAFTQGLGLMRHLRQTLCEESGHDYSLYHVLHNNASLGGASNRKRYFFLASRVPFGVERIDLKRIPTLGDVLQDLSGLGVTWDRQPYRSLPNWWSAQMRDGSGTVDGMDIIRSPLYRRARYLLDEGMSWQEGETVMTPTRELYDKLGGDLPRSKQTGDGMWTQRQIDTMVAHDFAPVPNSQMRWRSDRLARVITGGGLYLVVHPWLNRTLTHREVARIQGFPDSWRIEPLRRSSGPTAGTWGKGIPTHAGRWIAHWARESIEGRPGSYSDGAWPSRHKGGRENDEYVIDVTNDWRPVWERQTGEAL